MITSADVGKALDKVQHHLWQNILSKWLEREHISA